MEIVIALSSAVLTIITGFYVVFTYKLLKVSRAGLEESARTEKFNRTMRLLELWLNSEITKQSFMVTNEYRKRLEQIVLEDDDEKCEKLRNQLDMEVNGLLGYMEHIGLLYRADIVDRGIVKNHFSLVFPKIFEILKPGLDHMRKKESKNWENVYYIVEEMKK